MEEQVIMEGKANIMKRLEGVGGTLYLTESTLIHKPHKFNVQSQETSILLENIKEVEKKNDFLVLRNLIIVRTDDGIEYKFRVYKRDEWVQKMTESVEAAKSK